MQTQLFQCHREERSDVAISLIHLKRLPRPFRARNDIVKIYIAFILVYFSSYTIPFYLHKVGLIVVNCFFDSIFQAVSGAETKIFLCFG